jgi:hypothetical protein
MRLKNENTEDNNNKDVSLEVVSRFSHHTIFIPNLKELGEEKCQ